MSTTVAPTVYYQTLTDVNPVGGEKLTDARYVGLLDPNRTELNVQSAFTKNDKSDTYRFHVQRAGTVGISSLGDGGKNVNVQVYDHSGRLIADSTATSGKLKDTYTALTANSYQGVAGQDYYIKATRGSGVGATDVLKYSLQVRGGSTYRDDYTSIEKPAATTYNISGGAIANSILASRLSSTFSGLLSDDNFFKDSPLGF